MLWKERNWSQSISGRFQGQGDANKTTLCHYSLSSYILLHRCFGRIVFSSLKNTRLPTSDIPVSVVKPITFSFPNSRSLDLGISHTRIFKVGRGSFVGISQKAFLGKKTFFLQTSVSEAYVLCLVNLHYQAHAHLF